MIVSKCVGELRNDLNLQGRLTVVGAEPRSDVGTRRVRGSAHNGASERLQPLLRGREVRDRLDAAIADHQVGLPREDRPDECRDVRCPVLIVGIRVHDHVGAEFEAGVEARLKGSSKSLVIR